MESVYDGNHLVIPPCWFDEMDRKNPLAGFGRCAGGDPYHRLFSPARGNPWPGGMHARARLRAASSRSMAPRRYVNSAALTFPITRRESNGEEALARAIEFSRQSWPVLSLAFRPPIAVNLASKELSFPRSRIRGKNLGFRRQRHARR